MWGEGRICCGGSAWMLLKTNKHDFQLSKYLVTTASLVEEVRGLGELRDKPMYKSMFMFTLCKTCLMHRSTRSAALFSSVLELSFTSQIKIRLTISGDYSNLPHVLHKHVKYTYGPNNTAQNLQTIAIWSQLVKRGINWEFFSCNFFIWNIFLWI